MNTIQEEQTTSPEIEAPPVSYDEAKLERIVFEPPPGLEEPIKTKTRQTTGSICESTITKQGRDRMSLLQHNLHVQEQSS